MHLKNEDHGFCEYIFSLNDKLLMHATGVDVKSGSIFCRECDDFIYDATMDSIYLSTVVSAEEKQTKFQGLSELNKWQTYRTDNDEYS